jgi:uncharacterized OB-fold protein
MNQITVADDLFTWPSDEPHLLGTRCTQCATRAFPVAPACQRCSSELVETIELSTRGTVWTWTSQEFRPPSPPYDGPGTPAEFDRYFVGFVQLPDELCVEAHLTGFEGRNPEIGEDVELAIIPFRTDDEGNEIMIHAFAPATADPATAGPDAGGRSDG